MYQQLQKICMENVSCIKVFRANLEKFGRNILCTPKTLPAPTPTIPILSVKSQQICGQATFTDYHTIYLFIVSYDSDKQKHYKEPSYKKVTNCQ